MDMVLKELYEPLLAHFPAEWVTAALTLNLLTIWVVIGLFIYLNHHTRQERFGLWTASWMFYSVHLAASISLTGTPAAFWLLLGSRACIGISALLMFWGSLQLTHRQRSHRELAGGIVLIVVWSCVAALRVGHSRWVTVPVFALFAAASIYTGITYLRHRLRYRAGLLLGTGFTLWGLHLFTTPFLDPAAPTMTVAHLASAALTLFIALGMLVEQEQLVSEQDYRALFQSASDAIVLVDCRTHAILEANTAAGRLAGRDPALLVGLPCGELLPEMHDRIKHDWDVSRIADEINRINEFTWARPDGHRVICEARAHVARCPRGWVLQINARDTTHLHHVTAELHVRSAALDVADSCLLLSDREGRVIWVNPAFTAMTGFALADARGEKAWFLKTPNPDSALLREFLGVLRGDGPWSGEVVNHRRDGSTYRERLTITPVRDARGVLTNFVTVKQDLGPVSAPPPGGG